MVYVGNDVTILQNLIIRGKDVDEIAAGWKLRLREKVLVFMCDIKHFF